MKIRAEMFGWFHSFILRFGLAALLCAALAIVPALAADCSTSASLSALGVSNMTIASATVVPPAAPNPEYCDVKGSVATSGEGAEPGSANFEIMLPANWNQKFIFHGVGGLAGSLTPSANPADQSQLLARGYATAITDTGHLVANPDLGIHRAGHARHAENHRLLLPRRA